jgi:hypothetical protein
VAIDVWPWRFHAIQEVQGVGRDGDKTATIGMVGQLSTANGTSGKVPLVIDLDGALLKSDLQDECALQLARRDPAAVFQILYWLTRGRVAFRRFIVARSASEIESAPARGDFIAWTESEHAAGRPIVLAAADPRVAQDVAARFAFIDEIIATDGEGDAAGRAREDVLCARFPGGYIYAGCSAGDLAVWRRASGIVLVNASGAVERQARAIGSRWRCFHAMR